VAYAMLLYVPNHKAIAETRRQIETKRQEVAQATMLASTLALAKKDLARAKEPIAAWNSTTTDARQMALLFGRINDLVKSSGAVTTRFDPERERRRQRIVEIPLSLGIAGTFAQIQEFLRSLERLPTTIWIESLKMAVAGKDGSSILAEIKLVVFTGNSENSDYVKYSTQPIN
jgi:Tfp pilus assembly protein PilO